MTMRRNAGAGGISEAASAGAEDVGDYGAGDLAEFEGIAVGRPTWSTGADEVDRQAVLAQNSPMVEAWVALSDDEESYEMAAEVLDCEVQEEEECGCLRITSPWSRCGRP